MDEVYDVFVSYSHVDSHWVRQELVPYLEQAGLKVMGDWRFDPGRPSDENMESAVERSRHTVVVLTQAWVDSAWCGYEGRLIFAADPAARQAKLIPVLLETCQLPTRISTLTWLDFRRPEERPGGMVRLVEALGGTGDQAPPPSGSPPRPELDWRLQLTDLLVRSGRASHAAREALCLEIGSQPAELEFLVPSAPRTFATLLVRHLDETGNQEVLLRLCDALAMILRGEHAARLQTIRRRFG
jgi:hypothetical protein